jgi:hypothetical protein
MPGGLGQPVRGVIGGTALHLAQQPLILGQVKETGVPPVCEQQVFSGARIEAPPGPAAAVLVDAQIRHQRRSLLQHRVRRGSERRMRHRPGDPGVPGRTLGRARRVTPSPHSKSSRSDNVPINFEGPH